MVKFRRLHEKQGNHHMNLIDLRRAFAAMLLAGFAVGGCSPGPSTLQNAMPASSTPLELQTLWTGQMQRREIAYVPLRLPVVQSGMWIEMGLPTGPAPWVGGSGSVVLYSTRILRGSVTGPAVEQLTGYPEMPSDRGSFLIPLPREEGGYRITEPMPLYMKVEVSALQDPGKYLFPVTMTLAGKAVERGVGEVEVSAVSLPTKARVLAVATTTIAELGAIFPEQFSALDTRFLDRADTETKGAVEQLDALVKAAERSGVALFVEDIGPHVKIDEVGRVVLDWDAYDRLMGPYMEGSAFEDRVPLGVWLAPVPPARVAESPAQLRQYMEACAQHFVDKGWVATPAFMHEALVSGDDGASRAQASTMLRLHLVREMLAVTTPDANVPQPRLWVVDDADARLPPAGALATEESVRVWPWVCAARSRGGVGGCGEDVRGFVWRHAVQSDVRLQASAGGLRPLFVALRANAKGGVTPIVPSLRMVWLQEGLNDVAMLGLVEARSDPSIVQELFAGIVGRTGLTGAAATAGGPAVGYLYAGWPEEKGTWAAVPTMLEKLVLAGEPGATEKSHADDPLYLATKLWLAKSRRPLARVGGYGFQMGMEGNAVDWDIGLVVENPVNSAVEMSASAGLWPGDLEMVGAGGDRRSVEVGAYGVSRLMMPVRGHLDTLEVGGSVVPLEVTERNGGAAIALSLPVPMMRMEKVEGGLKVDGFGKDWPAEGHGEMRVGTHYLSRPALVTGATHGDESPAMARWAFDANFVYVRVRCPQATVADERNNEWPIQDHRWWGTDGVQIQMAGVQAGPLTKVIELGFKPGGVMMTRVATVGKEGLRWSEGPPAGGVARYGTSVEKVDGRTVGYLVEAAIPRRWFAPVAEGNVPAWRVNVLRHRGSDLASMSWSGPLVSDEDVGMMGLLVGVP